MRARWRVLVGMAAVALAAVALPAVWSPARPALSGVTLATEPVEVLELYFRSPVLVRAGERVTLPVDVVCATSGGHPCGTTSVTLRTAGFGWRLAQTVSARRAVFDLSGVAGRALAGRDSASIGFTLSVEGPGGRRMSEPPAGQGALLRFFVSRTIPVASAPSITFGVTRRGRPVLTLPWGSGPTRAGVDIGREGVTLGPSSFDVDRQGRVHVADPAQRRIAVFSAGRLVRETPMRLPPLADVAVASDGSLFVLEDRGLSVQVRRLDPTGRSGPAVSLGAGIAGQVRALGSQGEVNLMPRDTWVPLLAGSDGALRTGPFAPGRPVGDGRNLLRVIHEDSLRLGTVSGGVVQHPVEVRFGGRLGEVALAEMDRADGYWAVVHVWREQPTPADQYQAVHVRDGRVISSFAMRNSRFAMVPPLSRFRIGPDGNLYQLMTSPSGMHIVRYDLGEET